MSKVILWAGALSVLFCGFTDAEEPVYFADACLKVLVENTLWVPDPTPSDMLGLTWLFANLEDVADLRGLEYAQNLETFQFTHCEIHSLSPLSGLTNLHKLVVNNNHIFSIADLAGLTNLQWLDVHDNELDSISALANLTHLETLILRTNDITSISALAGLSHLQTLDLSNNRITDIAALTDLTSLTNVDLRSNPLNVDACTVHVPQILANNPGVTLKYDACAEHRITISSSIGGSVIVPGEGDFILQNGETLYLEAKANPGYAFVSFSGNFFETKNPINITIRQSGQIQANFVYVHEGPFYVDDDAEGDPGPNDPNVGDSQENGTVDHPFDSIQKAIAFAADDMSIVVRPGTYHENLDLLGKRLQLLALDGAEPNYPVLDGAGQGPVVRFANGEDPNCLLAGFVITGGVAETASAICCQNSSPTITNCLIVGNRATDANGAVVVCTHSDATLVNCTVADNRGGAAAAGIALSDSDVTLLNCIVWNNSPLDICPTTGGKPVIAYTTLTAPWSGTGNLNADPLFVRPGFWQTTDGSDRPLDVNDTEVVWVAGDYHLMSQTGRWHPNHVTWIIDEVTSPCIDAGDPAGPLNDEPKPNGNRVNMGAYGGTAQASMSP